MKKFIPFVLSWFCLLCGCNKLPGRQLQTGFTEFYEFGDEGMIPGKEYLFDNFDTLAFNDSLVTFSLFISLRYSDLCEIRSLPLNFEYSSLSVDSIKSETLDFPLFLKDDYNDGKGNFGIYSKELPLIPNIKLSEGFFLSVSTKEKNTKGIISLGIIGKKLN